MRRWVSLSIWLIVLLLFSATVVLAAEGDDTSQDILWQMLAPVIAIAATTERVLEMFWDRYEHAGVWPNPAGILDNKADNYIFWKKQRSQWYGTAFAFVAIGLTNARFFYLLGVDVLFAATRPLFDLGIGGIFDNFTIGTVIDWFATAGIIGWGGTELVHNLIEALIKGRGLWKETQQVRAGEVQLMDTKIFKEFVLPQIEAMGLPAEKFYQIMGLLRGAGVPLDELTKAITNNTLDEFFKKVEGAPNGANTAKAIKALLESTEVKEAAIVQVPNVLGTLSPQMAARLMQIK